VSFTGPNLRIFNPSGAQVAEFALGRDHPGPRTITRSRLSGILRQQAAARGIHVEYTEPS
jgi:hypothetical protein